MATDFVPYGTGGGANVMPQVDYIANAARTAGQSAGFASSALSNKAWRQSTFVSAGLATFMTNTLGVDVPDDGDLNAFVTLLGNAISSIVAAGALFSTGDVKTTLKTAADTGWVMMNDGSIGSPTSGATTRANNDTQALFTLLWNNVSNTDAPVSGGRGASAAADWAANKNISLPKMLGRALGAAGAGSGLTNRALGSTVGSETHVLTTAQMPSHSHELTLQTTPPTAGAFTVSGITNNQTGGGFQTGLTGGGAAHNIMQPTVFLNYMIKL